MSHPRCLKIINARGALADLTITESGLLTWEYRSREGSHIDPVQLTRGICSFRNSTGRCKGAGISSATKISLIRPSRSCAGVQNAEPLATYSSIWATTSRRDRVSLARFTSTNVGTASWSTTRWSTDHQPPPPLMIRHAGLTLDQQPPARILLIDLRSGQQVRMLGKQSLEVSFRLVARPQRLRQRNPADFEAEPCYCRFREDGCACF